MLVKMAVESVNVEDLCALLEDVASEEGKASANKKQGYEHALKQLLELTEEGGKQAEVSEGGKDDGLSLATRARMLSVVAGHIGTHYWTSHLSRTLSNKLLTALCQWHGCKDVEVLESSLGRSMLTHLQTCLHSDNWRQRPIQKQSLHPNVSPLLGYLLPPVLWMLDDHSDYHRSLALSLISHIIDQTDSSELRWQGRAELFYQALRPLLYVGSVQVIGSLHSCMLRLLPVLDYSPNTSPGPDTASKADEVFSILITSLAKESKLSLQRAYTAQVKHYLKYLGIRACTHIKDVLPLLLSLLLYPDPDQEKLRRLALEGVAVLISSCWPRMALHQLVIVKALATLMAESREWEELMELVVKCLSLLQAAVPQLRADSEHLLSFCEEHQHPAFRKCLQLAMAPP